MAGTYHFQEKKPKTTIRRKRIIRRFTPTYYPIIKSTDLDIHDTKKRKVASIALAANWKIRTSQEIKKLGLSPRAHRSKLVREDIKKNIHRTAVESTIYDATTIYKTRKSRGIERQFSVMLARSWKKLDKNSFYLPITGQAAIAKPGGENVFSITAARAKPEVRNHVKSFEMIYDPFQKRKPKGKNIPRKIQVPISFKSDINSSLISDLKEQYKNYVNYKNERKRYKKIPAVNYISTQKRTYCPDSIERSSLLKFPQNTYFEEHILTNKKFKSYLGQRAISIQWHQRLVTQPAQLWWRVQNANKGFAKLYGKLLDNFFLKPPFVPIRIDDYLKSRKRRITEYCEIDKKFKILRLFYGNLTKSKIRKLLKKTKGSQHASFLFGLMEKRLDVLLWRTNICKTLHDAQQMVRNGHIVVEGRVVRSIYAPIRNFQIVSFAKESVRQQMKIKILERLRLNKMRFPLLQHIKINYNLMCFYCIPISEPYKNVPFPKIIDHSTLRKYIK